MFVCIVGLAGTCEGLAGPREFKRELIGVVAPSDLAGLNYNEKSENTPRGG